MDNSLDSFLLSTDRLYEQLRESHNISDDILKQWLSDIHILQEVYKESQMLPKRLINSVIDLPSAMLSCIEVAEEGKQERLYCVFDQVSDELRTLTL
jgi:hypothetical protein